MVTPLGTRPTVGANCHGFVTAGVTRGQLEIGGKVAMTFRRLFSSVGKTIYPGSASPKEIKTYLQLCLSFYYKVDLLTRRVTIPASLET